jgi:hypothetical protein
MGLRPVKPWTVDSRRTNDSLRSFARCVVMRFQPMKNPLLAIALSAAFAVATARAASSESSDIYYSRQIKYMSMMRSPDWWNSGELTGDWGRSSKHLL